MEIKYELKQPYTEQDRLNFIVEQNHKNGYEIREENGDLVAYGYTEDELAQQKQQAIAMLTLTPADVERALYKATGMDFEDLKALIAEKLPTIDTKALAIEFRAKDFYRGAEVNGVKLFNMVGQLLGYTPEDIDYLFENKELPVKEVPTDEDTNEDTTDTESDIHDELETENDNTTTEQTDTNPDTVAEQDTENQGSADEGQEVLQANESVQ